MTYFPESEFPSLPSLPVLTDPDVQNAVWFMGSLVRMRARGKDTGGAFALLDHTAERGYGSPHHVHQEDDETFFVLEGELRVIVSDTEQIAGPGSLAILPRKLSHSFVVTSPTARFLHTPAGFDDFTAELGVPADAGLLAPPASAYPDVETTAAAASRYGMRLIGPPPKA